MGDDPFVRGFDGQEGLKIARRCAIGMNAHRQPAIGALDLGERCPRR
jgi:hypothetical protein